MQQASSFREPGVFRVSGQQQPVSGRWLNYTSLRPTARTGAADASSGAAQSSSPPGSCRPSSARDWDGSFLGLPTHG